MASPLLILDLLPQFFRQLCHVTCLLSQSFDDHDAPALDFNASPGSFDASNREGLGVRVNPS